MAMTVREAEKCIENIDNEVKNIQKLLHLSKEEYEELADKLCINSPVEALVNTSVNAMLAYKNILREKIKNARID